MIYHKTFPQQNKTQIIQYIAALCGSLRGAQAGYRRSQAQTPRSEPLETRAMQPLYELSSCGWLPGNSFSWTFVLALGRNQLRNMTHIDQVVTRKLDCHINSRPKLKVGHN